MIFSLTWLPAALKEAGLKVALVDGWESRGRGDVGRIEGVICHHTAGPKVGNMPSLDTLISGRPDLQGPLSQVGLGRDGTYYVIAAGRCNHAGEGVWKNISSGNTNFIGIEAENTGLADDPWPDVQIDAYRRGAAAILKHIGRGAEFCCGHKEYARPAGRKNDPLFDMDAFRAAVAGIIAGTTPPPTLIPAIEPTAPPGAQVGRDTLRRGMHGELVKVLQRKLRIADDGIFGADTEVAVREFQRNHSLVPDGIVGPKTWRVFDAVP
jgi:peptidoglycan hydrolase-like protein with peptidoglycan-binding domain